MPRCEGRPDGPCPAKKNDSTVRNTQGDLFLCPACDEYRFPTNVEARSSKVKKPVGKGPSTNSSLKKDGNTATAAEQDEVVVATGATVDPVLVVNELLSYVCYYRNSCSQAAIAGIVCSYYTPVEITAAKKCLIGQFHDSLSDTSFVTERRSSTSRPAHEAELDDIFGVIDYLDQMDLLNTVLFAATNFARLPRYGPEEINVCSIADRQAVLNATVTQLATKVEAVSQPTGKDIISKIDELQAKVDSFSTLLHDPARTLTHTNSSSDVDRSHNVVILGIKENRDPDCWRDVVSRGLEMAARRPVHIADAVRLGRFSNHKHRPILVKLSSVWDRRLILSGTHKLRDSNEFKQVFIKADESPDVRRRKTFERLKKRAENQGQTVTVTEDGILRIDDVAVYCMKQGYVGRRTVAHLDG